MYNAMVSIKSFPVFDEKEKLDCNHSLFFFKDGMGARNISKGALYRI